MSYCLTVLNTNTFELRPLMGDRVNVEFIEASETTGIKRLSISPEGEGTEAFPREGSDRVYNLSGQRVGASYKGIVIQNGRKIYKK
jgi:hypothetical protein